MNQKIAIISTYPPNHCGIATYAYQMAEHLQKQKFKITKISTNLGENADYQLNLKGQFRLLQIIKLSLSYDKIIINYQHSVFFSSKLDILITNLSLIIIFLILRNKISIICHEFEPIVETHSPIKKIYNWLLRTRWRTCPRIFFHTHIELDEFIKQYSIHNSSYLSLIDHGSCFQKYTYLNQGESRQYLGLPEKSLIFICIGFFKYSKGFDRIVNVFNTITIPNNCYLYLIGSVQSHQDKDGKDRDYCEILKQTAIANPSIKVIEKFLSDEEFDNWINASDILVIPYRNIWSSGVLERAKLYNKKCIVSSVGGLPNQISTEDYLFSTDVDLESLTQKIIEEYQVNSEQRRGEDND